MIEKVRSYPQKWETHTMSRIKEVTLISSLIIPNCEIHHKAPAIIFITANSIFPDQDVVLVISKARDWWVNKHTEYYVFSLNTLS